ncbi:PREDICTED: uncharacterized protein LOC104606523 isoform X2 [Nelumbo nucifera]|uniref:GrpE protein homolog n=2 Tax=Nelumbo nucifera TaxID=4432 RepID=A0A1U8AUC1_NELNU|nr:PREDICTED: uncharacterized protein LOC104606523 isoform X2 [Nelumbo nucifera]DAD20353.1 TPA_asm: hypothetical protein HUJ06_021816 [Nelumbo nucifera]
MFVSRIFSRISRNVSIHARGVLVSSRHDQLPVLPNSFHSLRESIDKCFPSQATWLPSALNTLLTQQFGISSSASPQPNENETNQSGDEHAHDTPVNAEATKTSEDTKAPEKMEGTDDEKEPSFDDLVKLVAEKEEQLKAKHKEIEKMQDKVLRTYAEMENVMDRTKREAENSKKFSIQSFAKSLLDVADNLGRASSVVKDSFSKIDASKDTVGAVPLLKTLLEGVEMTDKQLVEVFRKFGVEKFDSMNEQLDPHRHNAVFQIPDSSKPPGTVAAVLKPGYMLYDRVIRPAEVGVTRSLDSGAGENAEA